MEDGFVKAQEEVSNSRFSVFIMINLKGRVCVKVMVRNVFINVSRMFLRLTCAMLVIKKGSQALKKRPKSTPRVRLAFRALFLCLCANLRSLFTDS